MHVQYALKQISDRTAQNHHGSPYWIIQSVLHHLIAPWGVCGVGSGSDSGPASYADIDACTLDATCCCQTSGHASIVSCNFYSNAGLHGGGSVLAVNSARNKMCSGGIYWSLGGKAGWGAKHTPNPPLPHSPTPPPISVMSSSMSPVRLCLC